MRLSIFKITKTINQPLFYPVVLLLVGLAAYGILFFQPGFYWDDWESVYLYGLHNPGISFQYFYERPFSSFIYLIFFPITKMTPLLWLVISFFLRWFGVLGIYYTLDKVWPDRVSQNRWTGLLLFVFPAFLQQPIALCYSRHFTSFALLGFSLLFTVLAIRDHKRSWLWLSLSILFGLAQFFIIEYFVGLEILRPLIIWFTLRPQNLDEKKSALRKTLLMWAPFVIGLAIFFWWRFFELTILLVGLDKNNPELLITLLADKNNPADLLKSLTQTPITSIIKLIELGFEDLKYLLVDVWIGRVLEGQFDFLQSKIAIFAWSAAISASVLAGLYITATSREVGNSPKESFPQILLLGFVAFLAGGIPYWANLRFIAENKWADRYALAPMVGAAILIVNIIDWMFRTRIQKQVFLSYLLIMSISVQVFNSNYYRRDWALQKSIYWQFAWRVPSLKAGTAILGTGTFTDKNLPFEAMYELNLLLEEQVKLIPNYGYFSIYELGAAQLSPNAPLSSPYMRSGEKFIGNSSQAIGMYFDQGGKGCVRLLDTVYSDDPDLAEKTRKIIPLSDINLVMMSNSPTAPDLAIFGPEPPHNWCYYFEKADLARQFQDWETIIEFSSIVESKALIPSKGIEYLPFIEAFAQMGNWAAAYDLSVSAEEISPRIGIALCNNWNRFVGISGDQMKDTYLLKAREQFCENLD